MKAPDTQLRAYYKTRASVYDRVYDYPERQTDPAVLKTYVADQFTDRHVIEVAAGTGYWTKQIAR